MRNVILFLLPFVLIIGCSKSEQETPLTKWDQEVLTKASEGHEGQDNNGAYNVMTADIDNYVHFKILEAKSNDRDLSLKEVVPLMSPELEPLMYVINYNEGWDVISGDKRTPIVLAHSDHGSLDVDSFGNGGLQDGILAWLDGEAAGIYSLRKFPKETVDSSSAATYAQENVDYWNVINSADNAGGDRLDPNVPPGHWEVVSVTTQTVVLDSCYLNVPVWKKAEPYTTYDSTTEQFLSSPIVAAGKMMKAMYDIWDVSQTTPTDSNYPTITWSNLSQGYNSAVGSFLSQLCAYIIVIGGGSFEENYSSGSPRTNAITEIDIAQGLLSLYKISSTVDDYNASTVQSMLVSNGIPVVVSACNTSILWGLFYSDAWTFVIDKYRTLDQMTITVEEWVYEDTGSSGFLPVINPRTTVTHTYPTQIGMNWGFSYSQQHHTDGDDLWFSYTNWSVFGYTFPYQRKMLSNIYRIQ